MSTPSCQRTQGTMEFDPRPRVPASTSLKIPWKQTVSVNFLTEIPTWALTYELFSCLGVALPHELIERHQPCARHRETGRPSAGHRHDHDRRTDATYSPSARDQQKEIKEGQTWSSGLPWRCAWAITTEDALHLDQGSLVSSLLGGSGSAGICSTRSSSRGYSRCISACAADRGQRP